MKLTIRNVAKIEEAILELNGITVIAGNNDTGKSTVGKAAFALFNSLVNIEEKLEKQKEKLVFQMLQGTANDILMKNDEIYTGAVVSPPRLRRYARELIYRNTEEQQQRILLEYLNIFKGKAGDIRELSERLTLEIDRINQYPVEILTRSAVSAYFNQVFSSEINNMYQPLDKAVIEAEIGKKLLSITFQNNACTDIQQQVKILNSAVYLDNPFVLDCLNNGLFNLNEIEKNTADKLANKVDAVESIVQRKLIEDKVQDVLYKINEVSSGRVLLDESRSYYYSEQGKDERLNINNLSAGLKSFVIIKTLLENGGLKQKDILILDEPEIHLHPDWQLRYAEIIILLQKTFDFTIILTTHSAHFIEALQYYARKNELENKCTYYLSSKSQSGCKLKDVTDDPTEIFAQLVDASILLDRLKFKMEEAEDE